MSKIPSLVLNDEPKSDPLQQKIPSFAELMNSIENTEIKKPKESTPSVEQKQYTFHPTTTTQKHYNDDRIQISPDISSSSVEIIEIKSIKQKKEILKKNKNSKNVAGASNKSPNKLYRGSNKKSNENRNGNVREQNSFDKFSGFNISVSGILNVRSEGTPSPYPCDSLNTKDHQKEAKQLDCKGINSSASTLFGGETSISEERANKHHLISFNSFQPQLLYQPQQLVYQPQQMSHQPQRSFSILESKKSIGHDQHYDNEHHRPPPPQLHSNYFPSPYYYVEGIRTEKLTQEQQIKFLEEDPQSNELLGQILRQNYGFTTIFDPKYRKSVMILRQLGGVSHDLMIWFAAAQPIADHTKGESFRQIMVHIKNNSHEDPNEYLKDLDHKKFFQILLNWNKNQMETMFINLVIYLTKILSRASLQRSYLKSGPAPAPAPQNPPGSNHIRNQSRDDRTYDAYHHPNTPYNYPSLQMQTNIYSLNQRNARIGYPIIYNQ